VLVGQCGPPQPLFKGLVDIPISQVVSKSRPDDQIDSQHRVAYDTVGMWHQSRVTRDVFFFFFFFFKLEISFNRLNRDQIGLMSRVTKNP
jgi:hypothetical protein